MQVPIAAAADPPRAAAAVAPPGYRQQGTLLVPTTLDADPSPAMPRLRAQAVIGRGRAIDPWPFADGVPQHPGYGLSPQRVVRIFRDSELGSLWELQDLYDDLLESDGHLRALFNSRIQAVGGKGWVIQSGGPDAASKAAAEALDRALEDHELDLVDFMEHQLEAPFRGYSASEIEWGLQNGFWVPVSFDDVAHRRFAFIPGDNSLRLTTPKDRFRGEELWPDQWVVTIARHQNMARAGLFRTATWWSLFKRLVMRDWIVFAERFGIPHTVGVYQEGASLEARQALEQALKDLGEGGQAILHEMTRIQFSETQRAGDPSSVHPAIAGRCDSEISKLLTGATLTVESGGPGSFALGKVHETRAYALEMADANRLERVFRRFVAVPFLRLNGFDTSKVRPPRMSIQVIPELDPRTRIEIMASLRAAGADIDVAYEAERLGFRRPMVAENAGRPPEPGPDDEREDDELQEAA